MQVEEQPLQCFSSIQQRKLPGAIESCRLCPSMDLVLFGTSASSQHNIYRTVSWQKVASINPPEESKGSSPALICWSPNGEWVALGSQKKMSLYHVEQLANPPSGMSFGNSATEDQHRLSLSHSVIGVSWVHVGRPHPTAWEPTEDELASQVTWR